MELICPTCHTQLTVPNGVDICRCSVCGQVINIPTSDPTQYSAPQYTPAYQQQQQPHYVQQPKSNNTTTMLIAVLSAVIAAVFGAAVVYFLTHTTHDTASTTNNTTTVVRDTIVRTETVVQQVPAQTTQTAQPAATTQTASAYSAAGQGLYPFASTRRLSERELSGYTARQLKIMRNEIYARHGYIFQTADMKNYFAAQPWYRPVSNSVSLSSIEQANVATIQRVEATK